MKHIEQIRQSHPLLPIAKKCISDNQEDRPSAEELCQILAGLKDKPEYKSSTLPAKVDPQYAQELLKYNKELRKEVSQKDKKLKELKEKSRWERDKYVEDQGWATMPFEKVPDSKVAEVCVEQILSGQ